MSLIQQRYGKNIKYTLNICGEQIQINETNRCWRGPINNCWVFTYNKLKWGFGTLTDTNPSHAQIFHFVFTFFYFDFHYF